MVPAYNTFYLQESELKTSEFNIKVDIARFVTLQRAENFSLYVKEFAIACLLNRNFKVGHFAVNSEE